MKTTRRKGKTPTTGKKPVSPELAGGIRAYVRTYVLCFGRDRTARAFGVSRQTLWRFLNRGHLGRAIPCAVMEGAGRSVKSVDTARDKLIREVRLRKASEQWLAGRAKAKGSESGSVRLSETLEDTLRLVCAAPLATLKELSRFGRIPLSTLRGRLKRLTELGLVGAVSHHLGSLGPHPQQRYFPRERGIVTGGRIEHGTERFLSAYPVSRRWFRLWAERLDAVAVLYRVAAMVADADPHAEPLRVDHYRQGPYDMLLTLSKGRSVGVIRQGAMLPSTNLRYRLRTAENLYYRNIPRATLVIACSDQANRRAVRTLRDPVKHHTTFVTTEGELLVGDHRSVVWQRCDNGRHKHPPPEVSPDVSLTDIVRQVGGRPNDPQPNPAALYPERLRATMPEPSEQLGFSLAVLLTRAEKDALRGVEAQVSGEYLALLGGGGVRGALFQSSMADHALGQALGQPEAPPAEGEVGRSLFRACGPRRRHDLEAAIEDDGVRCHTRAVERAGEEDLADGLAIAASECLKRAERGAEFDVGLRPRAVERRNVLRRHAGFERVEVDAFGVGAPGARQDAPSSV